VQCLRLSERFFIFTVFVELLYSNRAKPAGKCVLPIPNVHLHTENEKVLGETQTLRAGRSNAEPHSTDFLPQAVGAFEDCLNCALQMYSVLLLLLLFFFFYPRYLFPREV